MSFNKTVLWELSDLDFNSTSVLNLLTVFDWVSSCIRLTERTMLIGQRTYKTIMSLKMKDLDELFDVLLGNWVYRVLILLFYSQNRCIARNDFKFFNRIGFFLAVNHRPGGRGYANHHRNEEKNTFKATSPSWKI